eukprot:CAMPEP_0168555016 /NCGR_PEP_ID=MMETSP0413-20121227/8099_1 /TAXON_ID=136452 /ORGANISM="Filamoeba nolandi, Strain NC-AS-23-1" /LENGTH=463 /DNA_ID=CAMNT_0008585817 /DNA_START=85 /DNA_END=1474 /DNA_ORIENTATION=-
MIVLIILLNSKNGSSLTKFHGTLHFGINLPEGNALIATKEIAQDDLLLKIPSRLMLSTRSSLEISSELNKLLDEEIVRLVPSLGLALRLIYEKNKLNSFWAPYIKILPEKYTNALYYTFDEIALLKGSLVLPDAVKFVKTKVREYSFVYNAIKNLKSHILNEFTFTWAEYRWAASAVASRQNMLPIDGQNMLVLIPFWDLANHSQGKVTTFYDEKTRELECQAMTNFKKGDQITIFYGVRPNYELFLLQGFVYDNNQHDAVKLKFDIPANTNANYDLRAAKIEILKQTELVGEGNNVDETVLPKNPGPQALLPIYRTLSLTEEDIVLLQKKLQEEKVEPNDNEEKKPDSTIPVPGAPDTKLSVQQIAKVLRGGPLSEANEKLAQDSLLAKLQALLAAYPTSFEEDQQLLKEKTDLTTHARTCIALRASEKKLIDSAIKQLSGEAPSSEKKKKKKKKKKPASNN